MASIVVDIHKKNGKRPYFEVYIGRAVRRTEFVRNTKWANLFYDRLDLYEDYVKRYLWDELDELENKVLGCWCITTDKLIPLVCHGQILMKLLKEM